jgi:hypothetical protein
MMENEKTRLPWPLVVQSRLERLYQRYGVELQVVFSSHPVTVVILEKDPSFEEDRWNTLWLGSYEDVLIFLEAYTQAYKRLLKTRPATPETREGPDLNDYVATDPHREVCRESYHDYLTRWKHRFGCLETGTVSLIGDTGIRRVKVARLSPDEYRETLRRLTAIRDRYNEAYNAGDREEVESILAEAEPAETQLLLF